MPAPTSPATDDAFGLACWQGRPALMDHPHRHDDIEVNLAADDELTYLFGGRVVTLGPGEMAAFWAAVPHQLVAAGGSGPVHWLTVPLSVFLGWRTPGLAVRRLLAGEPVVAPAPADPRERDADVLLLRRWAADLAADDEARGIAVLEIEARLRRLVRAADARRAGPGAEADDGVGTEPHDRTAVAHAARMVRFVALHFRQPLTADRIAAAVPLHPHYAMTLFREVVGTTLTSYVTQCRVAEAQRLLVTTDLPVTEIGTVAGFGSQTRFYTCFTAACGRPPGGYRALHRDRYRTLHPEPRGPGAGRRGRAGPG
ncbi:helix-turn-helix domain-containing protein [Streptomyces sp. NPDC060194]|uniref:helix-turn-helix domain-containing protein n=1 Tax=Streptomyces sp. NPDC060194 TaxID=3347069 RepID=UPI00365A9291